MRYTGRFLACGLAQLLGCEPECIVTAVLRDLGAYDWALNNLPVNLSLLVLSREYGRIMSRKYIPLLIPC